MAHGTAFWRPNTYKDRVRLLSKGPAPTPKCKFAMKNILLFTAGLFVAGLSAAPVFAQGKVAPAPKPAKRDAITPTEKPNVVYPATPTNNEPTETPAVAPTPDQVVRPLPREERGTDYQPIPNDRPQN